MSAAATRAAAWGAAGAEPEAKRRLLVIAHRGASGYAPENTMAAFDLAAAMGADYLELDVQMTRDGQPVVIHDATLERTTNGSGAVKGYTLAQLQRLDAGSWFGSKYKGERVPSLKEVLDRYYGRIGLFVEIKSPELYPGIEASVARLLAQYGGAGTPSFRPVILQSFSAESVEKLRELMPDFPLGVLVVARSDLTDRKLRRFEQFAGYINMKQSLAGEETIRRIHDRGMKVFAWTVRGARRAELLRLKGVDGIVTNFPDEVMCRVTG
ncbi:hypothetical protein VN24_06975 [Paenibacillus beijingensis]|uniref:GP-PDE domain-containing protein n=2 Tax=Paenibacillus beijingensis TaxID=1126833 RepID=A0A0D5NQL8_9BACL|nr:hypothetical protein VN24_06975 [Paenibacillus beijingensis]